MIAAQQKHSFFHTGLVEETVKKRGGATILTPDACEARELFVADIGELRGTHVREECCDHFPPAGATLMLRPRLLFVGSVPVPPLAVLEQFCCHTTTLMCLLLAIAGLCSVRLVWRPLPVKHCFSRGQ